MTFLNPVLESIEPVIAQAQDVAIDKERLEAFVESIHIQNMQHWMSATPIDMSSLNEDEHLNLLLVFNAISFSYWEEPSKPKWAISEGTQPYDRGTWNMIAAIVRAHNQGTTILNPEYLAYLSENNLEEILRGNTQIPLLRERHTILQEIGKVVIKSYGNSFRNVVDSAQGDALVLLEKLVTDFPSFDDASVYGKSRVYFHKRAQLLVSDICTVTQRQDTQQWKNQDRLTACADYKLPMVLRYHGVLRYSPTLAEKIDHGIHIPHQSKEEVEIRAATIAAVEIIKERLQTKVPHVTSMMINDYLWLMASEIPAVCQHHRTRTTTY